MTLQVHRDSDDNKQVSTISRVYGTFMVVEKQILQTVEQQLEIVQ